MHENWSSEGLDFSGFLHYLQQPGTATDNASISQMFTQLGINDQMLQVVLAQAKNKAFLEQHYVPVQPSLDDLLTQPENSFGHQWAQFMMDNKLNPKFFKNLGSNDIRSYIINRLHDTHDMWHVILGFDTSEAGEAGMNAFTYAQVGSPTTCMLMAAKLVRAIGMDDTIRHTMMHNICRGYTLGMRLSPFLAVAWEEHWSDDLSELRQQVGLQDGDFAG